MLISILSILAAAGLCVGLGLGVSGWLGVGMFVGLIIGALFGSVNATKVRSAVADGSAYIREKKRRGGFDD